MNNFFRSEIVQFLCKTTAIYAIWYVVYELWILPNGWIDDPLSMNITSVSAGVLSLFTDNLFFYHRVVGLAGAPGIEIVNGCNGVAAMGLFIGFIFAYPGEWTPRIFFSILGIAVLYLVNILRVTFLAVIQLHWPAGFDFTHEYSTTAVFYIIIFLLWMVWTNYSEPFLPAQSAKSAVAA